MFDTREALVSFFKRLDSNGYNEGVPAAMMIGMVLTLKHPEYAQAFFKSFTEQIPVSIDSYVDLAARFCDVNPIEVEV